MRICRLRPRAKKASHDRLKPSRKMQHRTATPVTVGVSRETEGRCVHAVVLIGSARFRVKGLGFIRLCKMRGPP